MEKGTVMVQHIARTKLSNPTRGSSPQTHWPRLLSVFKKLPEILVKYLRLSVATNHSCLLFSKQNFRTFWWRLSVPRAQRISFKNTFLLHLPTGSTRKPVILSEPQDVTVVSTSFSLLCIKSPDSTVTWYHNDKQVNTVRNNHIHVTSDGSILVKNALEGRDDGSYYCLVSNRKGAIISRTARVKFACKWRHCYLITNIFVWRHGLLLLRAKRLIRVSAWMSPSDEE